MELWRKISISIYIHTYNQFIICKLTTRWQRLTKKKRRVTKSICDLCFFLLLLWLAHCSFPCKKGRMLNAAHRKRISEKGTLYDWQDSHHYYFIDTWILYFTSVHLFIYWVDLRFDLFWNLKNIWRCIAYAVRLTHGDGRADRSNGFEQRGRCCCVATLMSNWWDNNLTYIFYNGELKDINLWWMGE